MANENFWSVQRACAAAAEGGLVGSDATRRGCPVNHQEAVISTTDPNATAADIQSIAVVLFPVCLQCHLPTQTHIPQSSDSRAYQHAKERGMAAEV